MSKFCTKCGTALGEGTRFCTKCGAPVPQAAPPQQPVQPQPEQPQKTAPAPVQPEKKTFCFNASDSTGETVCGVFGKAAESAVSGVIPGPGKVIGSGIKSLFSSIGSAFKDPKKLIPAIVLAVIWIVLIILRACGINPLPTRIMSFLTFADAGMNGGVLGVIGGIVGKGLFAGAVVSLIGLLTRKKTEGKRSFKETLSGAFGVSLETLWAYLTGIGAAMLLYLFISGGATRISFMGGIAASYLAARAALTNGFMKRLLGSFASKGKAKAGPGVAGLLRGLAAGFAAAALIGLSGINLILIIAGSVLVVGGAVMMILSATGVVKLGKEARVQ